MHSVMRSSAQNTNPNAIRTHSLETTKTATITENDKTRQNDDANTSNKCATAQRVGKRTDDNQILNYNVIYVYYIYIYIYIYISLSLSLSLSALAQQPAGLHFLALLSSSPPAGLHFGSGRIANSQAEQNNRQMPEIASSGQQSKRAV